MSLSDAEILELNALCSALVDRSLDHAGRTRLNAMLTASEDARRFYVRNMALSASLHDYAGELQSDEPSRQSAAGRIVRFPAWRWALGSLAAAAAIVLAFWLGGSATRESAGPVAAASDEEPFVATLSATNDCHWHGASPALGEELSQGQQLELISGLAEVTFNSGAQVVLEGPATLDLASAWEAVLRRGSVRANVPPEAIGFRVSNPDVEVTDLGTEFSMVANEGGGTEVFVLKGSVQASGNGRAQTITLREQQARRFDRSSITEVRDREQKLKRWAGKSKFAQFTRPADYVHWSFDEPGGSALRAELIGFASSQNLDGQIRDDALAGSAASGHHERALALDGRTIATARMPELTKTGATIAFWLRVPEDAALMEAGPIIAIGDGSVAEISWNRDPTQGAVGALRTETGHGQLIGATPLRDGRWHHVAVVFAPNGRARQYVDGRLEAAAAKRLKLRHGEKMARARHAAGGATNVIAIGGSLDSGAAEHFRGLVDELFFAGRALTPPEIRQLLRENNPAPVPTVADSGRADL